MALHAPVITNRRPHWGPVRGKPGLILASNFHLSAGNHTHVFTLYILCFTPSQHLNVGSGLKAHTEPDAGKGAGCEDEQRSCGSGGLTSLYSLCRCTGWRDTVAVPDLGAVQLTRRQVRRGGLFTPALGGPGSLLPVLVPGDTREEGGCP